MPRKKVNKNGPQPIKLIGNAKSVKHGFFPDTYPGGYEAFDNGDGYTVEHLPKDGVCNGTTIIRRYKVTTDQLLQKEGYPLRPLPDDLYKFLKKYPHRKKDLIHLIPSEDIRKLTNGDVDYTNMTLDQLYKCINVIDENKDPIEFMYLDGLITERLQARRKEHDAKKV